MNPSIIKIASLTLKARSGIESQPSRPENGGKSFSATFQNLMNPALPTPHKSMNPAQTGALPRPSEPSRAGLPLKKIYALHLESLRKGLLAKGKPLSKISLKSEDIHLLKKFLSRFGLSPDRVKRFLKELADNSPTGEINLSLLFKKIGELGQPKERHPSLTLEPSAIPHIESALRFFGLTPQEIESALSRARVEGGGLDLGKLLTRLRQISHSKKGEIPATIDQNSARQILGKLEEMGIRVPNGLKGVQPSIKGLITALEQVMEKADRGVQLQGDLKGTVDRIVERAAVANNKEVAKPHGNKSLLSSSFGQKSEKHGDPVEKEGLLSLTPEKKADKAGHNIETGNRLSPFSKEKAGNGSNPVERDGLLSSSFKEKTGKEGDLVERASLSTTLKEKATLAGKLRSPSDLNGRSGSSSANREEHSGIKSETRTTDVPHTTSGSTFSEAVDRVKQAQRPPGNSLPAYLTDQVGRQIARSVLRGERVLRLQLKPPELGFLRVEIDVKDNVLRLGMIAEHSSVKEILLSHVHELREALVQQGLKLDKVDVQIGYNFGQSPADLKEGQKEERRRGQEMNRDPFSVEGDMEDPLTAIRSMTAGDHLLDLVA